MQTIWAGFSVYELLWYFWIYSTLGWMMETTLVSMQEKRFVNRGFLNGCYCPIYGCGMCAILLVLTPCSSHPVLLYLGGVLLATVLEYATGWLLETLFCAKWWDYSQMRWNLHGRVCLKISLSWGALATVLVLFVQPLFGRLVASIPLPTGYWVILTLMGVMAADLVVSAYGAAQLSQKLRSLSRLREELRLALSQSGLADAAENLQARLAESRMHEVLAEARQALRVRLNETEDRAGELRERLETIAARYTEQLQHRRFGEHRLLRAYPHLRLYGSNIVEELRERLQNREHRR